MQTITTVKVPESLLASPRQHNKQIGDVLFFVLYRHLKETMPDHFTSGAAQRYHHEPRNPEYNEAKARYWKSFVDLRKTRRTEKELPGTAKIGISGSASQDTLRGTLKMRMSFAGGTGRRIDEAARQRMGLFQAQQRRRTSKVTPAQMVRELETVIPEQIEEMSEQMQRRYVDWIKDMKRPRLVSGVSLANL